MALLVPCTLDIFIVGDEVFMIGANGIFLVEPNDENAVKSKYPVNLENDRFVFVDDADKKIIDGHYESSTLLYINKDGKINGLPIISNAYLCIDINGNLMFRRL